MIPSECRDRLGELGCALVIPTYNNAGTLAKVIDGCLEWCGDVIVVNDGCTDATKEILSVYGSAIKVLTHPVNYGKGCALRNAMDYAVAEGFRYVITMDADGQHFPDDLPVFVDAIIQEPDTLLVGARNLNADGMPGKNTFANKFSNLWFRIETGIRMQDTQSGFRLYPLEKIRTEKLPYTGGYEFELEILVFAAWDGIRVKNVPVNVAYPEDRVSHFRPFRDFAKISILNTLLVLYCLLWRWPMKFLKSLTRENVRNFIDRNIIHSPESNFRIAAAAALGVFMGIVPVWGYQMIIALALAHLLSLNKVIVVVASNISIPPMIPFILFGSYWTGCKVLGSPMLFGFSDFSWESIAVVLTQYVAGAMIMAAVCAVVACVAVWGILTLCKRGVNGK